MAHHAGNHCSVWIVTPRLECRADYARPMSHDAQPHARVLGERIRQASAVILHPQRNSVIERLEVNNYVPGFAMFDSVANCFLRDSIEMQAGGRVH